MKKQELKLFAIYKNGEHLGNEKATNKKTAVKKYIINAGFKLLINDEAFVSKYTAIVAIEEIHFYKLNKPNLSSTIQ